MTNHDTQNHTEHQNTQTQLKFRTALLKCARHMSEAFNQRLEPYELNYSLWQVIYLLHEHQSKTCMDLAKHLNVSKPSIAKRVQVLEQLDLIDHVSTHDKRQKRLKLNDKGIAIYQTCSADLDLYEAELLQSFDQSKLNISTEVLNQVLKLFQMQLQTTESGANE